MSVGYPDYARLSEQGGFQLFGTSGNIANEHVLFSGWVGSWPYLNLFVDCNSSADACRIAIAYYTDSTFGTQAGFRYAIRNGASFSITQYANLSPWVIISVETESGNPFPFLEIAAYASIGVADQVSLSSLDVPIFGGIVNINAGITNVIDFDHIQPGNAVFTIQTQLTDWFVYIEYFDYGSDSWIRIYQIGPESAAGSFSFTWPMLDAPHRITAKNSSATNGSFVISWISV